MHSDLTGSALPLAASQTGDQPLVVHYLSVARGGRSVHDNQIYFLGRSVPSRLRLGWCRAYHKHRLTTMIAGKSANSLHCTVIEVLKR